MRQLLGTRWFWYSILTVLAWAAWALLLKAGSTDMPGKPAMLLQTLGMAPLALWLLLSGSVRVRPAPRDSGTDRDSGGRGERRGIGYSLLNGIVTGIGILFLLAAYRAGGNTSVVSVTTALYPLVTCALAFVVLREKLRPRQWAGLALSVVAIVMFAL